MLMSFIIFNIHILTFEFKITSTINFKMISVLVYIAYYSVITLIQTPRVQGNQFTHVQYNIKLQRIKGFLRGGTYVRNFQFLAFQ